MYLITLHVQVSSCIINDIHIINVITSNRTRNLRHFKTMSLKAFNNSDLLGLKGFQTFSQLHIGRLRKSPPACKQDRKIKERDVKDRVMGCPSIYMNVNTYWIYIYI